MGAELLRLQSEAVHKSRQGRNGYLMGPTLSAIMSVISGDSG